MPGRKRRGESVNLNSAPPESAAGVSMNLLLLSTSVATCSAKTDLSNSAFLLA